MEQSSAYRCEQRREPVPVLGTVSHSICRGIRLHYAHHAVAELHQYLGAQYDDSTRDYVGGAFALTGALLFLLILIHDHGRSALATW